jgi:asparagine synthetase B (glutamine-hydrolysing)
MIGIHVGPASKPAYRDHHANYTEVHGGYSFTISYHEQYRKQSYFSDPEFLILLDGWIFNAPDFASQAEHALWMYRQNSEDFVFALNGQFNLLIVEKRTGHFRIWNDIFAFRKHFYTEEHLDLTFSPDIDWLRRARSKYSLDSETIRISLANPRTLPIDKTLIAEIGQFTPHSILVMDSVFEAKNYQIQSVRERYEWKATTDPSLFISRLKEGARAVHRDEAVTVLLSGGLDSRFLLEMLKDMGVSLTCATYGNLQSDEVLIAKRVADANEVQHFVQHLEPGNFIKDAERYVGQTGGLDIFVQSSVFEFYENMQMDLNQLNRVIDSGFALDAFLGGTQINSEGGHAHSIHNRVFSTLAIRQSAHREYFEDRYSMYEYGNYFMMSSLPLELIENHSFYFQLVQKLVRNSLKIPLQSTMMDLTLDSRHWSEAAQIQSARDEFTLNLVREFGLKTYHNRYYSDFDMWLRDDPNWQHLLDLILEPSESLLAKRFVERSEINARVRDHTKGIRSESRKIIKWLSLELFFRFIQP